MSSAILVQRHRLSEQAMKARMPHSVAVEGIVKGVELVGDEDHPSVWPPSPRKKAQEPTPVGVRFCHISGINIIGDPQGDGRQVASSCLVSVTGGKRIMKQARACGLLPDYPFDVRAKFFANGSLNVELLQIEATAEV